MADIDFMEWAIRVRERADRLGMDLHDAFAVEKMPEAAWQTWIHGVRLQSGPNAETWARSTLDGWRSRVCGLAGSLVAVRLATRRAVTV